MDTDNKIPPSIDQEFTSSAKHDDPLLLALLTVCKLLHTPQSIDFLTAGLPLVNNKLTPKLFVRAAERAGLTTALIKRPLAHISNLVLPAILILNNQQTCILTHSDQHQLTLIMPESETGEKKVTVEELQQDYSGYAFFIHQRHQFDHHSGAKLSDPPKHWFWDVIFKSWPVYSEVLVASLLINLFALASPLFIMNVYDRVVPNHAIETLWVLATGIFIVFLFDLVMKILRGYFIDTAGKRADIILSSTIFEKILGIRMAAKPPSVGAFANNLHEFESFREFLTSATLATVIDLPFLFLFLFIIWMLGGSLVVVPIIAIPLALLAAIVIQKPLKNTIQKLFGFSAAKGATLVEALSNLESIKTANAEGQVQKQWEDNIGQIAQLGMKSRFLSSCAINITTFFQQTASIGVVIYGVYKITDGDLTTGGLIACTILTGRTLAPIAQVASLLTRYHQARASLDSLNQLMALPVERETEQSFLSRPHFQGNIEFKNVSFSYPQQPVKALNNISLKITSGEKIALLGRVGSGKSTIEKLILNLYQPQDGSILLDGTDLQQINPADLRRQIGYVPQDISLMSGSVRDNINFGCRYADDSAILTAAKIAGVNQFVDQHPQGFDMQVGERGASLSSGQRQSIAIARALLQAPLVYIMDEPTNAMDNSTEDGFKRRLSQHLTSEQTLILITHRASLLMLVDRIIVLESGKIIADGPKQQILEALKQGRITVPA
jgi:ATP-binding cassette subfamily C protein LapB